MNELKRGAYAIKLNDDTVLTLEIEGTQVLISATDDDSLSVFPMSNQLVLVKPYSDAIPNLHCKARVNRIGKIDNEG